MIGRRRVTRRYGATRRRTAVLVGAAVLALVAPLAADAAITAKPVASFTIGDPGVMRDKVTSRFVTAYTGTLGNVTTARDASGHWSQPTRLLTKQAAWASTSNRSLWAPSIIKLGTSNYITVFAAVRSGWKYRRCIGVGHSTRARGPFAPYNSPLSCTGTSSAPDKPSNLSTADSLIDATLRYLTVNGTKGLYVTYKSQRGPHGHYYTTVRMVRLSIGTKGRTIIGHSHQLTVRDGNIEENPVMVQRGANNFTLFTSVGGYTLCTYHTEYRHSTNPWSWGGSTPHRMSFPSGTCGTGDADVYPGLAAHSWRVFFSGRYPKASSSFKMYVGVVAWSGNTPRVTKLLAGT